MWGAGCLPEVELSWALRLAWPQEAAMGREDVSRWEKHKAERLAQTPVDVQERRKEASSFFRSHGWFKVPFSTWG